MLFDKFNFWQTSFSKNDAQFLTTRHYVNSQNTIIKDIDFLAKICLFLYPSLENSTTHATIICTYNASLWHFHPIFVLGYIFFISSIWYIKYRTIYGICVSMQFLNVICAAKFLKRSFFDKVSIFFRLMFLKRVVNSFNKNWHLGHLTF